MVKRPSCPDRSRSAGSGPAPALSAVSGEEQRHHPTSCSLHNQAEQCVAAAAGGWAYPCSCDIPRLLGMGIKHSKLRDRHREGLRRGIDETSGGEDNNHHNHHYGIGAAALAQFTHPGPLGALLSNPGLNQAQISPDIIHITKFKVGIDKRLTTIDERSPGVLKYKTPHFR